MKEKYYEFLNMAVVDSSPIKNSDFLRAFTIEVVFALLIFIASIFIKGEYEYLSHCHLSSIGCVGHVFDIPKIFQIKIIAIDSS